MSKAYQCDRCRAYFKPEEMQKGEEFLQFGDITVFDRQAWIEQRHVIYKQRYDLCPECTTVFWDLFMKDSMVDGERGFYAVDWKHDKEREAARKENKAEDEEDGV